MLDVERLRLRQMLAASRGGTDEVSGRYRR
jgi:hypothetical protein